MLWQGLGPSLSGGKGAAGAGEQLQAVDFRKSSFCDVSCY